MDALHLALNWLSNNRWTVALVILACLVAGSTIACQPTTASLVKPTTKVTPAELDREIADLQASFDKRTNDLQRLEADLLCDLTATNAKAEAAQADLQRQVDQRKAAMQWLGGLGNIVATGAFPGSAIAGSVASLLLAGLSIGLGADNIRKSRVIGRLKNGTNGTLTTQTTVT